MLFSLELDKTLYLILKNDRKNRKEILRLLNSIPKELYHDVQKTSRVEGILTDFTGREYYNSDKTKLYRLYSMLNGCEITIIELEKVNNDYKETVELTLSIILWQLGSFVTYVSTNNINDNISISDEKETEYEVIETGMRNIFIKREEDKKIPRIGLCTSSQNDELTLKKINNKFNYIK